MSKCIVIGGGILGASTAFHLAKRNHETILIDRFDAGQATDAAAGIICPWLSQRRNKAWYALVKNGANYYPELIRSLEALGETKTGYKKVGALALHKEERSLMKMIERAKQKRQEAPEIGELTPLNEQEIANLYPAFASFKHALYVSGGARVDGRMLREALLRAAKTKGATLIKGNVEQLKAEGVVVDGERLEADKIIVTAGAWANELLSKLQLPPLVSHQKAEIIHLQLPHHKLDDSPVVMPQGNQYLVPFSNGKVVVGSTHEDTTAFHSSPSVKGVHHLLEQALLLAPGLKDAAVTETRVGYRPFTANFLPAFGKLPNHEHILFANGLGASGLTVGPYLGNLLSLIISDEDLPVDASLYALDYPASF